MNISAAAVFCVSSVPCSVTQRGWAEHFIALCPAAACMWSLTPPPCPGITTPSIPTNSHKHVPHSKMLKMASPLQVSQLTTNTFNFQQEQFSRKLRKIESGSWERWFGWRGWQTIIFKWPDPPDDHLQVVGSSKWSFARGWIFRMIICKRPDPPDDHLQVAGSSRWSFTRGRILRMTICKRPDPPDDPLQ